MKMEQTQCSETSAIKHHTPENNPKGYTRHTEHGESLKSRMVQIVLSDNLHYHSLKPFGVTEDSAALADVHFALSLCPRVSVHCAVNIRFLRIILEEGARNVCLRRADTRHF
jgi:hypothetical protein